MTEIRISARDIAALSPAEVERLNAAAVKFSESVPLVVWYDHTTCEHVVRPAKPIDTPRRDPMLPE